MLLQIAGIDTEKENRCYTGPCFLSYYPTWTTLKTTAMASFPGTTIPTTQHGFEVLYHPSLPLNLLQFVYNSFSVAFQTRN